jgi:hypothetical protein
MDLWIVLQQANPNYIRNSTSVYNIYILVDNHVRYYEKSNK